MAGVGIEPVEPGVWGGGALAAGGGGQVGSEEEVAGVLGMKQCYTSSCFSLYLDSFVWLQ